MGNPHLIILGGGISGLAAAYYARKAGRESGNPVDVTVLEAEPRWGGKITTERHHGFVVEGGPDTFLATKPWGVSLCRELGLADRLYGTNPSVRNTYVLHQDRLMPLPEGLLMMIPTRFFPILQSGLLSWGAKVRMGMEFLIPPLPINGDESLGAFVTRRLGRQAYENLIEPLMSGIYAGNGDQLSLQATFPQLRELELTYGGLAKGALAVRKKVRKQTPGKPANTSRSVFLTPKTGLAEMIEGLVGVLEQWGVELRSGVRAEQILWRDGKFQIALSDHTWLSGHKLILAVPAYAAGALLRDLDPDLTRELTAIPYASTATISLAYRNTDLPRPLDGYGYVIPRLEGRQALACTWTSTKFPHRAPEDTALLRVFVGRSGQEDAIDWDESGLLVMAKQELEQTLGITAEPLFSKVFRWEKAMPQYLLGHPQRLERLDAAMEKWPDMALAGNGYRGIGIPDCIHSGQLAVERVLGNRPGL